MERARLTPAVTVVLALALSACGWHAGLQASYGAESVGVEIFSTERDVIERNLEPMLSDALTRAVVDLVDLRLVKPKYADLVIRGRILENQRRSGIRTTNNTLAETGVYFSVSAELIDRRTGSVVVPSRERHVWSGYALGTDAGANEAAAVTRALTYVAETLVLDLFGPSAERESKTPKGVGTEATKHPETPSGAEDRDAL